MYGLKQSPALWQSHFQSVMAKVGRRRCKIDANLYCHESRSLYGVCYVDDILVCGDHPLIDDFVRTLLADTVRRSPTQVEGRLIQRPFLGRTL